MRLRPWIAARQTASTFPDPSRPARPESDLGLGAWGTHFYLEVPYLTMQHPAITLWEHRQALARLKAQGRSTY